MNCKKVFSPMWTAALCGVTMGASPCALRGASLTIDLSTGLNASGTVQTTGGASDANWQINGQPARVVVPGSGDWYPAWAANDSHSAWVAKDPNSATDNGLGIYARTFDLTGVDLSGISITGTWALDDQGVLSLNGHQIASQAWDGWYSWPNQTFSVTDESWFNSGLNTLTMEINNTDNFYEGVRLNATLTNVPEPGALVLLGSALLAMLVRQGHRI